ncbi:MULTISPECIES: AAA family ATPase [Verrucomicrobium]|jgi:MoxR-like ATPase|uniref:AAA family ATPase n=1 Tax=Verrucomicrobium TaxID=2735 RepID=UPI00017449FF|nr:MULTISPECIES: MoxR family ATPase [Verrucomicrobium]
MSTPATSNDPAARLFAAREALRSEMKKCVVGQEETAELLLLTLLCRGHALLLGVPGVGKTLMSAALAKALHLEFHRVQFTPDLMPGDITGTEVLEEDPSTGRYQRIVMPGPLFANVLLADEINRTPPKTQAALLQAMQEGQVTIGRETYTLPSPFLVLATQNPIEMEGTYPLPEAQLDRFFFCIRVNYPDQEDELAIAMNAPGSALAAVNAVLDAEALKALQESVQAVPISTDVGRYAVRLASATRPQTSNVPGVTEFIECGASPRASQALVLAGKARALLNGRAHVDFADIRALAPAVLRHRLVLNFRARAEKVDADAIVAKLLQQVSQEKA